MKHVNSDDRAGLELALAHELRVVAWLTDRIGQTFAAQEGLHHTDFRALMLIYSADVNRAPITASALASALGLSPAATTYAVDRLVASGHVLRERDETDRRRVILRHAAHGQDVAASFFVPLGQRQQAALASFSDADLTAALGVISATCRVMSDFDADLGGTSAAVPNEVIA